MISLLTGFVLMEQSYKALIEKIKKSASSARTPLRGK